jgi:hypothetical protein
MPDKKEEGEYLMSERKRKPYSQKHDPNLRPDSRIEKEMKKRDAGREIPCALAFEIAEGLGVEPEDVGRTADVLDIPLVRCQLGLFGYKPENKIIRADDTTNQEIKNALIGSSHHHRLPCEKAWQIADRFNRYKSMLPGIELPKLLQSTLTHAAAVYQSSLQLIQGLDYAPNDIEELCALNDLSKETGFKQSGPMGIYLSALINASHERHVVLNIHNPQNRLHFLGFRLEKGRHLSVHGNVGHFTGAGLRGGYLKVTGSTGSWCGAEMTGGRIEITGDALSKTGARMKGGQIQVNGRIHEIAKHRSGGEVKSKCDR